MPLRLAVAASVMLVLSAFAFWPQYLSRLSTADQYTHTHAILGTCWLLLLATQPLLIRRGMVRLHRALGRLGVAIGAAFFATGVLTAHRGLIRMTSEQLEREGYFVYLPLSMSGLFGTALLLGVLWRSVPLVHSRFMACTTLPLVDPLLARILQFYFPPLPADFLYQVPAFVLASAVLVGLSVTLPPGVRGRTAFHLFSVGTVAVLALYFAIPYSSIWLGFTQWFRSLPIT